MGNTFLINMFSLLFSLLSLKTFQTRISITFILSPFTIDIHKFLQTCITWLFTLLYYIKYQQISKGSPKIFRNRFLQKLFVKDYRPFLFKIRADALSSDFVPLMFSSNLMILALGHLTTIFFSVWRRQRLDGQLNTFGNLSTVYSSRSWTPVKLPLWMIW